MADFVMTYIYLPLQLKGISGKAATVFSFVFMGLWHNISIGYLLWGVGHGLLLAYWPKQDTTKIDTSWVLVNRTMLWISVIGLSFIANHLFR